MVEFRRQNAGVGVDDDARFEHEHDRRNDSASGRAVNQPGLAGHALRLVVNEVAPGPLALDVRRHPVFTPLGQRRQGNRELPRHRREGDQRGEPAARAREPEEAIEHIHLWYG